MPRKSHLLITLGFGLAGAIGAAFGTGTAQAVVASLVEIVNSATSPVPTSSVNRTGTGRIAYQATVTMTGSCLVMSVCQYAFPAVPAGHRLVVQQISGAATFSEVPSENIWVTAQSAALFGTNSFLNFYEPASNSDLAFLQPALFYLDASESVTITVEDRSGHATFLGSSPNYVSLTGYELDCTVAACAAIATQ